MQNKTELLIVAATFAGIFFQPICVVAFVAACANYAHKRHVDSKLLTDEQAERITNLVGQIEESNAKASGTFEAITIRFNKLAQQVNEMSGLKDAVTKVVEVQNKITADMVSVRQTQETVARQAEETKKILSQTNLAQAFQPRSRNSTGG